MCKSHMCEWVHLCVCTNSKGRAHGQHQWMFKINLGFLNKYTNRTKNRVSAVLSCVGGGFFMYTLKYWGERESDALGFTTKFRNSYLKSSLTPSEALWLYGYAMPGWNHTSPSLSTASSLQGQVGKACPQSHRKVEKLWSSFSPHISPAHRAEHPGSWSCLLHC